MLIVRFGVSIRAMLSINPNPELRIHVLSYISHVPILRLTFMAELIASLSESISARVLVPRMFLRVV